MTGRVMSLPIIILATLCLTSIAQAEVCAAVCEPNQPTCPLGEVRCRLPILINFNFQGNRLYAEYPRFLS